MTRPNHFVPLAIVLCLALAILPASSRATGLVLLTAEPDGTPRRAFLAELERELDAMRPHLGSARVLDQPIQVRIEADFAEQGRIVEELGAAVVRANRLHLVLRDADLGVDADLVRHELARLLIQRMEWALPPAIEDGAALWLSGQTPGQTPGQTQGQTQGRTPGRWYGRTGQDWTADLASMDLLPTADELLAPERLRDGSRVLFTPVAAAVVQAMEGLTLVEKLDPMPSPQAGRALVARVLRDLAASARPLKTDRTLEAIPTRAAQTHVAIQGRFQNGVAFAMANGVDTGYHAPSAEERLDFLREMGVDAVSVMPFAYLRDPRKPALAFLNHHPASETDVGVVHAARRARERGMTVLWKPHLWIGHHSWPGDVEMTSEADWQAWFRVYRRYIVHHAVLAEHAQAEWFAVGVELGKTVHREAEWRHLIASVRRVYSGNLTYAGNWWGDYDKVQFWDALDAVGVDAYFPLAHEEQADLATLRTGARDAVGQLRAAAERWNRPVLLTEVGFAARRGAWVSPHEEGGTLSETDQRLAWQVLLSELGKPPWLLGVHAWKVFSHPRGEGHGKPDFRWLGRPAQQVLEAYYRSEPTLRVDVTSQ